MLQPKAEKKPDAKLPEWKPGGGGATNPVQRLLNRKAMQAKSGDADEQETDRVASQPAERFIDKGTESPWAPNDVAPPITQSPTFAPVSENQIQRQCADCAQEEEEQKGKEKKDLEKNGIQTKLTIGEPGDAYEQEADRIAAKVMSMPAPADSSASVQLETNNPNQIWQEAQSIADKMDGNQASGNLESRLNASKGGGSPLSEPVRRFMEPRFGADFSGVRVHTGSEAVQMNQELGAQAFTHGSDVYFGAGKSPGNNKLTAHELTHVVQQNGNNLQHKSDFALQTQEDDRTILQNADKDAANLLKAFQGWGTLEQVVYRILNKPPAIVKAIKEKYDQNYNKHTGKGLIEDIKDEFSGEELQFVVAQLKRAGIRVSGLDVDYQRHNLKKHAHIEAIPNERVIIPGTKITYQIVRGAEIYSTGSYYSYKWYALNDPQTSQILGKPSRIEGKTSYKQEFRGDFVGNHKIICKVIFHPQGGKPEEPVFYEFPQTVVPESQLATDALKLAQVVDPTKELEVLEAFLKVLLTAEKQEGSSKLEPKTKEAYEKQIEALKKRLSSTEGKKRFPIKAVHVDREQGQVSPLKIFLSKLTSSDNEETWVLVDTTNPSNRRLTGEYEGSGKNSKEAIREAIDDGDSDNRYPTGRIKLQIGEEVIGQLMTHEFQTDGASFWDSISEFFSEVGFWAGIGAIGVGIVTAIAPVPGSRVVSGLIWTSIIASSVSAGINIAQRHAEGMSTATEDAMDVLTIAGNVLAGTWIKGAKVLVNSKGGSKIATGILIGQFATDGTQAIILSTQYIEQYDQIMTIKDPKQRTDALMELFRSAIIAGGMTFISFKSTKSDLDNMGLSNAKFDAARLRNQSETIDLNKVPSNTKDVDIDPQRVKQRIANQSDKFEFTYTEVELQAIIKKGKELGLSVEVIEDMIFTGSRKAKAISANEVIQQMEYWIKVKSKGGLPAKFEDYDDFQRFSNDLLDALNESGLPTNDVRVQGSSLRKADANDVDIAVFVNEATFDQILIQRYNQRIKRNNQKIYLEGKSHQELIDLALDIKANLTNYNGQGKTFAHAIINAIISSKSDIKKSLKTQSKKIAAQYPHLNIESISVLIPGGAFDVKPDLLIKKN